MLHCESRTKLLLTSVVSPHPGLNWICDKESVKMSTHSILVPTMSWDIRVKFSYDVVAKEIFYLNTSCRVTEWSALIHACDWSIGARITNLVCKNPSTIARFAKESGSEHWYYWVLYLETPTVNTLHIPSCWVTPSLAEEASSEARNKHLGDWNPRMSGRDLRHKPCCTANLQRSHSWHR
jgi:hypothetical protein